MPPMLHNPIGNSIYVPLGLSLVCTKPPKLAPTSRGHLVQAAISKLVQPSSAYLQGWRSLSLTVHLRSWFYPSHFPKCLLFSHNCLCFLYLVCGFWSFHYTPLRRVWLCLLCMSQVEKTAMRPLINHLFLMLDKPSSLSLTLHNLRCSPAPWPLWYLSAGLDSACQAISFSGGLQTGCSSPNVLSQGGEGRTWWLCVVTLPETRLPVYWKDTLQIYP